jgi:hypothetical protein
MFFQRSGGANEKRAAAKQPAIEPAVARPSKSESARRNASAGPVVCADAPQSFVMTVHSLEDMTTGG